MKYNNIELSEYTKEELINILEQVLRDYHMAISTEPKDLEMADMAEQTWTPPQNVKMIVRGEK